MRAIDQLERFKSQAAELLDDPTFTQMRREGYGQSYTDAMVRSAIAAAKPQILGQAEGAKMQLGMGGLEFSGLGARVDADAISGLAGVASDAAMRGHLANEQVRQQAEQAALQVAMHEDSLNMQRLQTLSQAEASQPTFWDRMMQGASLVSMIAGRF